MSIDFIDGSEWVRCWQAASALMDWERTERLRSLDVQRAMELLDDAYESARRLAPPRTTSGLVILQALFAKGRQ